MMKAEIRQEVLNTYLAHLLEEAGVAALPERRHTRKLPDVYIQVGGLPVIIEAEVADQPSAYEKALAKAQERLRNSLCYAAVAAVYPENWRRIDSLGEIQHRIRTEAIAFAVLTKAEDTPTWHKGTYQDLANLLRQVPSLLLSQDGITEAIETLRTGLQHLSNAFLPYRIEQRLSEILGIAPEAADPQKAREATAVRDIAGLILMNALIFHEELTRYHTDIPTLVQCREASPVQDKLTQVWKHILQAINYHAVFHLAVELLQTVPPDMGIEAALSGAIDKARELVRRRAILRHDLAGRIYHLLLGDIAKPLATFYTSVPAAVLLLRLALAPDRWAMDWADPAAAGSLKIADFACGTGTLLMAALQTVLDNHLNSGAATTQTRQTLLKNLLEGGIYGFDVLESAAHLTATTLALPIPEVMLKGMRLYVMPMGIINGVPRLGSIDFLRDKAPTPQLSLFPLEQEGYQVTQSEKQLTPVSLPELDLVCMNPPFTRSSIDNVLFGSVPKPESQRLKSELKQLLKEKSISASVQAGLGAVFIALADAYLRPGGRLAFVLPKALLSGISWTQSRKLLLKSYDVEYLIVSHEPDHWNFSENTDLSEVLLIARKRLSEAPPDTDCRIINLWHNPRSVIEALTLSKEILRQPPPSLWSGETKVGETLTLSQDSLKRLPHWLLPCAFAQTELNHLAMDLYLQRQWWNGEKLPLIPLGTIGTVAADIAQVQACFTRLSGESAPTPYPLLQGHRPESIHTLSQQPNAWLTPRDPQKARSLWKKASRLMLNYRVWLNTQRATAVLLPEPALGSSWWPFQLTKSLSEKALKALVVWLNSSLGIFLMLTVRQETRGSWVNYKKENLEALLIPPLEEDGVSASLAQVFDKLATAPLQPLPELSEDRVRAEIDETVAAILQIPSSDLTHLRRLLAKEPILTLQPLRQRRG